MNASYQGVNINNWRSVKDHFMIQYREKMETTTFCHQIPKLVQDKLKPSVTLVNNALRKCKNSWILGESCGLVVKGEDSQLSGCWFESQRRILDGVSEASYYIGKRNKGSQMGHTKKNI